MCHCQHFKGEHVEFLKTERTEKYFDDTDADNEYQPSEYDSI